MRSPSFQHKTKINNLPSQVEHNSQEKDNIYHSQSQTCKSTQNLKNSQSSAVISALSPNLQLLTSKQIVSTILNQQEGKQYLTSTKVRTKIKYNEIEGQSIQLPLHKKIKINSNSIKRDNMEDIKTFSELERFSQIIAKSQLQSKQEIQLHYCPSTNRKIQSLEWKHMAKKAINEKEEVKRHFKKALEGESEDNSIRIVKQKCYSERIHRYSEEIDMTQLLKKSQIKQEDSTLIKDDTTQKRNKRESTPILKRESTPVLKKASQNEKDNSDITMESISLNYKVQQNIVPEQNRPFTNVLYPSLISRKKCSKSEIISLPFNLSSSQELKSYNSNLHSSSQQSLSNLNNNLEASSSLKQQQQQQQLIKQIQISLPPELQQEYNSVTQNQFPAHIQNKLFTQQQLTRIKTQSQSNTQQQERLPSLEIRQQIPQSKTIKLSPLNDQLKGENINFTNKQRKMMQEQKVLEQKILQYEQSSLYKYSDENLLLKRKRFSDVPDSQNQQQRNSSKGNMNEDLIQKQLLKTTKEWAGAFKKQENHHPPSLLLKKQKNPKSSQQDKDQYESSFMRLSAWDSTTKQKNNFDLEDEDIDFRKIDYPMKPKMSQNI